MNKRESVCVGGGGGGGNSIVYSRRLLLALFEIRDRGVNHSFNRFVSFSNLSVKLKLGTVAYTNM